LGKAGCSHDLAAAAPAALREYRKNLLVMAGFSSL
jgi:hypothetical protein